MRIAVLVGGLRQESYNRQVADAVIRLAPTDVSFAHSPIDDVPLYDQDDDADRSAAVKRLKSEIAQADGVMFVTPEYNRSVPGVLKNAIDHASPPDCASAWAGKPVGIFGVSRRCDRHSRRTAASPQHPGVPRYADARPA